MPTSDSLTVVERRIKLISLKQQKGLTNKKIADILGVSLQTINVDLKAVKKEVQVYLNQETLSEKVIYYLLTVLNNAYLINSKSWEYINSTSDNISNKDKIECMKISLQAGNQVKTLLLDGFMVNSQISLNEQLEDIESKLKNRLRIENNDNDISNSSNSNNKDESIKETNNKKKKSLLIPSQ